MTFRGWRKAGAGKLDVGRGAGELGREDEITYNTCEAASDDS